MKFDKTNIENPKIIVIEVLIIALPTVWWHLSIEVFLSLFKSYFSNY